MIGKVVGNYRIESLVSGKGGMGKVYLAKHIHLGTLAAVKAIHPHLTDNDQFKERFKLEAMSLYQLVQHPGIVRFFDYLENADGQFIITEFVEGSNLADYTKQCGAMPLDQLVSVFSKILDIVAFVHSKGIIHRDLKPANIMLTPQGEVKILDFGIAKVRNENLTATGTSIGTIAYLSPERIYTLKDAQGNPIPLDHRSDIYSLGVTLYEAATGQGLYPTGNNATSDYEVMMDIVSKPLPRLNATNPNASAVLQAIIDRATQKKPDQRYPNCEAFKNDLQQLLSAKPSTSKPPHITTSPHRNIPTSPKPMPQTNNNNNTGKKKSGGFDWWLVLLAAVVLLVAFFFIKDALLGDPPQATPEAGIATDTTQTTTEQTVAETKLPEPLPNFANNEEGFKQFMQSYYTALETGDTNRVLQHFAPTITQYYDTDNPSTTDLHDAIVNLMQQYPSRSYIINWDSFSYYVLDKKYFGLDFNVTEQLKRNTSTSASRRTVRMSVTLTPDVRIKSIYGRSR
ncbi:MAG: serine/threonine protein kinase [Chitinophagales bacterium]|jgi:serine/threonine protein kinase|nr:serine/threonine protein kinase [Chitinophagales bacterium]